MGRVNKEKFKVRDGVFDDFTLNTLNTFKSKKYFDVLLNSIKTGKEGDVFLASKQIEEDEEEFRAIKIYRINTANFNKISAYINRDYRFRNLKGSLRKIILAWTQKEFRNLKICYKAQMNVPFAYKQQNNVIIMDYIAGDMLKDTPLENPEEFFELLIEELKLMRFEAKLIHADLSEYNILVLNQEPVIIDLGQAMNVKNNEDFENFYDLYLRDITNIVNYFNKRYNLNLNLDEVLKNLEEF